MSEEKGTLGEMSFQTSIQSSTSLDKATHEQDSGHWSMPHPHPQDTSRTDNQDETAKEQSKGHQILDSTKDENKASERDNRTIKNKRGVASTEQPSPPLDIKRKAIEEKQEDVQQPKRPKRDPGLQNIGNTCYMNCVLQCFYHTEELRKLLLSSDISINPNTETKGTITTALVDLLTRMSEDTSTRDALYKLKQVVGEHDPEFRGPRQREAHDFLSTMLKWLTEELGEDPKVLETEPISRPRLRPSSLVDLFYGVHRSTFTCERTNTVLLTRNDHFSNLILAVNSLDTCELTDVLEKYYESQMVMWHCKECQEDHECRHEIRISRLPPVLIVHFSRYNRYEIGGWRKAGVSSPRKGLSLDAHLDDEVQRGQTYDLYAFCTHTGTMTSGHYIAHHRDSSGTWIEHDDSYVQADVHPNFEQAHILFYRANQKELVVPLVEGGGGGAQR
ncbi:probable ubiquitin carboxyl-terminal hydrolase 1 [Penaeus japonicus]|uniref:probable ubiquitin carboxyl-terminal hydrolase 1 n=1 Tax=Penaeus japonicus TaxID=27405 RepID=UPI001C71558E|nr:probable ubiquitin carboxyl-terminal hydrolase 1 [Penaeus japonicus]